MSDTERLEVIKFLTDLRDPERFGHAVSKEVRDAARGLTNKLLKGASDE